MRNVVTRNIMQLVPPIFKSKKERTHAPFLEVHDMGIERYMFCADESPERYNQALATECMYDHMGLIIAFSLN